MREQIQWEEHPFSHTQTCLDLIAAKPHGILRILDDQCNFPQVYTCIAKLKSKTQMIKMEKHSKKNPTDIKTPISVIGFLINL